MGCKVAEGSLSGHSQEPNLEGSNTAGPSAGAAHEQYSLLDVRDQKHQITLLFVVKNCQLHIHRM